MSYGVQSYLFAVRDLKDIFPYENENLKKYVLRQIEPRLIELQDQLGCEDVTFIEVANDFFSGKTSWPEYSYMYWYILEVLIADSGYDQTKTGGEIDVAAPRLNNSEWYPASIECFYKIKELELFGTAPTLPIRPADDFPVVFIAKLENMDSLVAKLPQFVTDPDQLKQFLEWISYAKKTGNDLFLFYY